MSGRAEAMILAAGRGERMRPLTDSCPKPLLEVRGKPLMQWHMEALGRAGIRELVVNTGWLGDMIEKRFGAKPPWSGPFDEPLHVEYSHEGMDFGGALETAGGIARALPLLADCFWVVGGDVHTPGFPFSRAALQQFAQGDKLAHLFLVPNPPHNPRGDFGLADDGRALNQGEPRWTYSTIGLFRQALFAELPKGNPQGIKAPLAPLLRAAMDRGQVSAEVWRGEWTDVGTPERLKQLNG